MQTAELTPHAVNAVVQFLHRATGVGVPNKTQLNSAMYLVAKACDECRSSFELSEWHRAQAVHSFEALTCHYQGTNHRWPPLTLNLHFTVKPTGEVIIATPEELPLKSKYHVDRVIADSKYSPDGD